MNKNFSKAAHILTGIAFMGAKLLAAGGMSGGGGEILGDTVNPWFMPNTKVVKTCLVVNPEYFHVQGGDLTTLQTYVDEATTYWNSEFQAAWSVGNYVQLATQEFQPAGIVVVGLKNRVSGQIDRCPNDTDLTIQFGYLTDDQFQKYFSGSVSDLQKFIAVSVRTSYDRVNLHGKGFIYVGADSGPMKFVGKNLVGKPWSLGTGRLITHALRHEFGHVFGIPHKGNSNIIMAADYLEYILSPEFAMGWSQSSFDLPFFKIRGQQNLRMECPAKGFRPNWKKLLQAPTNDKCYSYDLSGEQIVFQTGPSFDSLSTRGTFTFEGPEMPMWEEAVRFYLPDVQTVFTKIPPGAGRSPFVLGPCIVNSARSGSYVRDDGSTIPMRVTLQPMGIGLAAAQFAAQIDGVWHWNLDFE